MNRQRITLTCPASGFSLVELLVVIAVIFILSSVSLFYLTSHQRLFRADEQIQLITDLLQEARQRSLTQRETMRIEFNRDERTVTLIDENNMMNRPAPDDVDNDEVVRILRLADEGEVIVGSSPSNITYNPPEVVPVNSCVFKPSVYPTSVAQSVCTIRFRPFSGDGGQPAVVDGGTNPLATDAAPISVTVHVWSPKKDDRTESEIARAVTVIGATGSVRVWNFNPNLTLPNKWTHSGRTGGY